MRLGRIELIAFVVVILVVLGTPVAALGYENYLRGGSSTEFTLVGKDAQWSSKTIRVRQGQLVRLRLTSADVMHGFSIPKLGIEVTDVHPGKFTTVEFVAEKPGKFTYGCIVLCATEEEHKAMRGELIVEPADDVMDAVAAALTPQPKDNGETAATPESKVTEDMADMPGHQKSGDSATSAGTGDIQRIEMEAVDFAFSPTELRAKLGTVEIVITNKGRMAHGLWIKELGVNEDLRKGKTKTVRFSVDKPGRYEIRCNDELCGTKEEHESLQATLIVE